MRRRLGWVLALGLALLPGCGRGPDAIEENGLENVAPAGPVAEYARKITAERIREHVAYLASDELEGRHSGTKGGELAAEYVADRFRELGLDGDPEEDGSHFQRFRMVTRKPVECFLESGHGRADSWKDFMELHSDFSGEREVELVWAGYGRESDFEGRDCAGRLVAFFQGTPDREVLTNDFERVKIERALAKGAAGTLLVVRDDPPFLDYVGKLRPYFDKERYGLSMSPEESAATKRRITISTAAAARLFGRNPAGLADDGGAASNGPDGISIGLVVKVRMISTFEKTGVVSGANVIGCLEGTGDSREGLVLTAHYDHLGKSGSEIFNGAYDNAAGVAALLEVAAAFTAARDDGRRPSRSVLFLTPDAEELGGVGSRYYLEHPVFPLSRTISDINIDGIGREDAERPDLKDFVHLYLSRTGREDLQAIEARALQNLGTSLRIVPRENYAGSDHAFFEERLIPAVALSTGHPRDHHQPTDTADKLDYRNIRDIARLAFAMAWEVASGETTIRRIISE